jgi:hypothetical protein
MNNSVQRRKANFLRLVHPAEEPQPFSEAKLMRFGWQNTLFAADHPSLLVVVELETLGSQDFITLLSTSHPKLMFDLRRVPRFDITNMNRRFVFEFLENSDIQYVDLSGKLGSSGPLDTRVIADQVKSIGAARRSFQGPLIFLVDRDQFNEEYILDLLDYLPAAPDGVWDVLKLPLGPAKDAHSSVKSLVFLSHANPEDNNFAAWLAGKLAIAGYSVWSDVTKLIGGEIFWDDIESAIRNHAAKFVLALSRASQTKDGVLDEIDLAIRVERSHNLAGFVIPVRIDDLPFSEVRANIARKNIIDFNRNWTAGLSILLKSLQQQQVPKTSHVSASTLSQCLDGGLRVRATAVRKPELLVSNWLLVKRMPARIDLMDVDAPLDEIPKVARSVASPSFTYLRMIGMIGDDARGDMFSAGGRTMTRRYSIPLEDFLAGTASDLPGMKRQEANNHLSSLLRQAWNARMEEAGFTSYEMASNALAWFPSHSFAEGNKVAFIDDSGKLRRKQLVGWSARRQIFWHAAFEAKAVVASPTRIVLRPHVVFTQDGKTPIYSAQRMHILRRSFCKSWWNDRWRDLLIAFVTVIADENEIRLPAGPNTSFALSVPARLSSKFAPEIEDAVPDEDADVTDALDSDDDYVEESFEEEINPDRSGDFSDEY